MSAQVPLRPSLHQKPEPLVGPEANRPFVLDHIPRQMGIATANSKSDSHLLNHLNLIAVKLIVLAGEKGMPLSTLKLLKVDDLLATGRVPRLCKFDEVLNVVG